MKSEITMEQAERLEITRRGDPAKPTGEAGAEMLRRMNESHYEMTGWGLGFLDVKPEYEILDIGCGGGMTLKRLAEKLSHGHAVGVDYSDVSVQESSALNAGEISAGKVRVLSGNVESLPFSGESFDAAVTVESIYFWPDQAENLKEAYRVLKPGGKLLIICEVYAEAVPPEGPGPDWPELNITIPGLNDYREMLLGAGFSAVSLHLRRGEKWICAEAVK